jgi:hypothetical protein
VVRQSAEFFLSVGVDGIGSAAYTTTQADEVGQKTRSGSALSVLRATQRARKVASSRPG